MAKYYAVRKGRETGVFTSWGQVEPLVKGFPGAQHKSFSDLKSAQSYLGSDGVITSKVSSSASSPNVSRSLDCERPGFLGQSSSASHTPYDVVIYTDGSSNQARAGYGVVFTKDNQIISTFKGPLSLDIYPTQTNNQSELYAILIGLKESKEYNKILIKSDSNYSIKSLTEWYHGWVKNCWKSSKGTDVLNKELIMEILDEIYSNNPNKRQIVFEHVRAHCGIEFNELADKLANEGRSEHIE